MPDLNMMSLLYVENLPQSTEFYSNLLGKAPVETSPIFVMFVLDGGAKLGLWAKHDVAPAITSTGVGGELAFALPEKESIDNQFVDWQQRGESIVQPLTEMDFGRTFVAIDPDGYRIRMYVPN